jgi:hypothetical protein
MAGIASADVLSYATAPSLSRNVTVDSALTVTGLNHHMHYLVRVRAVNAAGPGPVSPANTVFTAWSLSH